MKVVSNSSPICYLRLIDQIHLLPQLFGDIAIPESVQRELAHESAPEILRNWIAEPPEWLKVLHVPPVSDPDLDRLHAGEREAILLAKHLVADLLLVDEKTARKIAGERGLCFTGLIGILGEAASRDMLNLLDAVERLSQTNFRVSTALLRKLLNRH